jgi:oligoendopeptidase F
MARRKRKTTRRKPIRIKKVNQGKLRKSAKVKKGKNIPVSKLRAMKNSKNPKTRKRATFALNARSWNKGGKRK